MEEDLEIIGDTCFENRRKTEKQIQNKPGRKCLQSTKPHSRSHILTALPNQGRHINSGKSPSNNNKQRDNTPEDVCFCFALMLLKCFVAGMIVEMLQSDAVSGSRTFYLLSPSLLQFSRCCEISLFSIMFQNNREKWNFSARGLGELRHRSCFESPGWDVMWFLNVRVTLVFLKVGAWCQRMEKQEKNSEPHLPLASPWNCGEREEAKLNWNRFLRL